MRGKFGARQGGYCNSPEATRASRDLLI